MLMCDVDRIYPSIWQVKIFVGSMMEWYVKQKEPHGKTYYRFE